MGIISSIILGGIVGAVGRLIVPGEQNIAIWKTILLGIVANLIVGLVFSGINTIVGVIVGGLVAAGLIWLAIRQQWGFLVD